jgi:myosin heavy subunit
VYNAIAGASLHSPRCVASKVFFSSGLLEQLEGMRSAATAAPLIRLQALHRMREARARFLRARNVLACMQVGSPCVPTHLFNCLL